MHKYNREGLAWAAGLFDGEGCTFYMNKNDSKRFNSMGLQLCQYGNSQNPPEVLIKLRNTLAMPLHTNVRRSQTRQIYGPHKNRLATFGCKKFRWIYQVAGFEKTQAVMALLWNWLSKPKREQYKKVAKRFLSSYHKRKASIACQNFLSAL